MYRSPIEGASRSASRLDSVAVDNNQAELEPGSEDGGFGDDFDEFEEGQEADDDFGEFDDGFSEDASAVPPAAVPSSLPSIVSTGFPPIDIKLPSPVRELTLVEPIIDWSELDSLQELREVIQPQISQLFPNGDLAAQIQPPSKPATTFLSDRSLSLYTQLVAPPPLAPPNWLRSRIRRLFLVSLGVPVDLDEILPASKQKKLILPSIHMSAADGSPRPSTDSRSHNGPLSKLKGHNDSSASLESSGNKKARRRKDEAQEPHMDLPDARRFGDTTEVKLQGMSDPELQDHLQLLRNLHERADEVLKYWAQMKDSADKEKDAFEGVIENLVKHAKKIRK
jgi:hypothetical protein